MNILVVQMGNKQIMVSAGPDQKVRVGEQSWLSFHHAKLHFLHWETERNLRF